MVAVRLTANDLQQTCSPAEIPFETTAEASGLEGVVGQERAVDALHFGIGIQRHGYNLFAIGPPGVGKKTLVRKLVRERAARAEPPADWCYVYNFANPERPLALELPPGAGVRFQKDMDHAVAELRVALHAVFDSEEYGVRRKRIIERYTERQRRALTAVQERAKQRDVAVLETDTGIAIGPIHDGEPIDPDQFQQLSEEQQDKHRAEMEHVSGEMAELLSRFHKWGHERRAELDALDREMVASAARQVLDGVRKRYAHLPAVLKHLSEIQLDVVDHIDELRSGGGSSVETAFERAMLRDESDGASFRRYRVNALVDHGDLTGAPVVCEDNPTYANLIGRIEHESQFGTLVTNFTLIRAGALHRAIGGYLILDALELLRQPFAWDALKRTIRSGEIKIEPLGRALGLLSTVGLEPASIPLGSTKIVLCGKRVLYYLLAAVDPEMLELFKVVVDFEDRTERKPETQRVYAELVASLVKTEGLRAFDRSAVARVIDHAARMAHDAERLSVQLRGVVDLLREADYWAGERRHSVVGGDDVQRAIDAQRHRAGRVQERLQEAIRRNDLLVSTSGESTGQINGLSVLQLGEHAFGHPTRITARVRLGKGELIDIEREVELGGPIHSKGVLILGGFLGSRYATRFPLSLSATLVFEQSYSGVEGDSASLAELCALLSALADVPLRQSFAITGSVNQQGQVQSVGAVNEKIEGFFDVCVERGLTGDQGVLIPRTNVKNLMLRRDVIEAVDAGEFSIHAVDSVDDAVELLTGCEAGERDAAGVFPAGSINALVEARLAALADSVRSFASRPQPDTESSRDWSPAIGPIARHSK